MRTREEKDDAEDGDVRNKDDELARRGRTRRRATQRTWQNQNRRKTQLNQSPALLLLQSSIKLFVSHAENSLSQNAHAREHKYARLWMQHLE